MSAQCATVVVVGRLAALPNACNRRTEAIAVNTRILMVMLMGCICKKAAQSIYSMRSIDVFMQADPHLVFQT